MIKVASDCTEMMDWKYLRIYQDLKSKKRKRQLQLLKIVDKTFPFLSNKKPVDFLDVTLNMNTDIYQPYKQPISN